MKRNLKRFLLISLGLIGVYLLQPIPSELGISQAWVGHGDSFTHFRDLFQDADLCFTDKSAEDPERCLGEFTFRDTKAHAFFWYPYQLDGALYRERLFRESLPKYAATGKAAKVRRTGNLVVRLHCETDTKETRGILEELMTRIHSKVLKRGRPIYRARLFEIWEKID